MNNEPKKITYLLRETFTKLARDIGSFEVVDKKLLPFGFKAHTRSISWIAEQVILQQAKVKAEELGFKDVIFNQKDTEVFDCIVINKPGRKIYVNIKITNIDGRHNKNDISAAERLYNFLVDTKDDSLFYVVFGIQFKNTKVLFSQKEVIVFSPVLLPEIYVNPKNAKLQAYYDAPLVERTTGKFLDLLYSAARKKRIHFPKRH